MKIRKKDKTIQIVSKPEMPFQEFVFVDRKNDRVLYPEGAFYDCEKTVLQVLSLAKKKEIQSNGFALMYLRNQDVSSQFQAKKFDKFWLEDEIKNLANEKVFYVDTKPVRIIVCRDVFKKMGNYSLRNSTKEKDPKPQSCLLFDVNKNGGLELRGGVTLSFSGSKNTANVFVDTKLCETFSLKSEVKEKSL